MTNWSRSYLDGNRTINFSFDSNSAGFFIKVTVAFDNDFTAIIIPEDVARFKFRFFLANLHKAKQWFKECKIKNNQDPAIEEEGIRTELPSSLIADEVVENKYRSCGVAGQTEVTSASPQSPFSQLPLGSFSFLWLLHFAIFSNLGLKQDVVSPKGYAEEEDLEVAQHPTSLRQEEKDETVKEPVPKILSAAAPPFIPSFNEKGNVLQEQ